MPRDLSSGFSTRSKVFSTLIRMWLVKGQVASGRRVNMHPGLFQVTWLWPSSKAMAARVQNKLASWAFPSVNYLGQKWKLHQFCVLTLMTNIQWWILSPRTGQSGFGTPVPCSSKLLLWDSWDNTVYLSLKKNLVSPEHRGSVCNVWGYAIKWS